MHSSNVQKDVLCIFCHVFGCRLQPINSAVGRGRHGHKWNALRWCWAGGTISEEAACLLFSAVYSIRLRVKVLSIANNEFERKRQLQVERRQLSGGGLLERHLLPMVGRGAAGSCRRQTKRQGHKLKNGSQDWHDVPPSVG